MRGTKTDQEIKKTANYFYLIKKKIVSRVVKQGLHFYWYETQIKSFQEEKNTIKISFLHTHNITATTSSSPAPASACFF